MRVEFWQKLASRQRLFGVFVGTVKQKFFCSVWAKSLFFSFTLVFSSEAEDLPAAANTHQVQLTRYLALTDAELAKSVAAGARVVRATRGLKAVVCSPAVGASLGL